MNIFACDRNPYKAAEALPDKLVVKMLTESAQMLSTVARERGSGIGYRPTHINHPCTKWLRESDHNIEWLIQHCHVLHREYRLRYGLDKFHKSYGVIHSILCAGVLEKGDYERVETFALAMPEEYRLTDPIESYRLYMQKEKSYYATWKAPARKPDWWKEVCKDEQIL